jgi:hypothetical protein
MNGRKDDEKYIYTYLHAAIFINSTNSTWQRAAERPEGGHRAEGIGQRGRERERERPQGWVGDSELAVGAAKAVNGVPPRTSTRI